MRWCNEFGVGKNPNKFGDDIVIDLVDAKDPKDPFGDGEHVAAIRLDREGVKHLIDLLTEYLGE